MLRWGRVEVSGGALLLGALLFYWDDQGLLLLSLLACAVHELGHYLAILALGGRVSALRITCVGADMCLSGRNAMGWPGQVLAALAGPLANLALGLAAVRVWGERGWCFAGINLALGAFNLLPAGCLDGGRALGWLLSPLLGEEGAVRFRAVLACALAAGLLAGTLLLAGRGRFNLTLPLLGAWLLAGSLSGKKDLQFRARRGKIPWIQ